MSYAFDTELFGLTVEVIGYFEEEELPSFDCEGCPAEFVIEEITHKGENLEVDSLPESELTRISKCAFEKALEDWEEY